MEKIQRHILDYNYDVVLSNGEFGLLSSYKLFNIAN